MLATLRRRIQEILEQRKTLVAERDAITSKVEADKRSALNDEETKLFQEKRAAIKALDAELESAQQRAAELEDDEKRDAAAHAALAAAGQGTETRTAGGAQVTSEPLTYSRYSGNSYFHDLARAQFRADHSAQERLNRHGAELRVELPAREKRREQRAREQMDQLASSERWTEQQRAAAFETRVNPNRTDGQGGFHLVAAAAA